MKKTVIYVLLTVLVLSTGYLGYDDYQRHLAVKQLTSTLQEKSLLMENMNETIISQNNTIFNLNSKIDNLFVELGQKEETIKESEIKIQEITETVEKKEKEVLRLKELSKGLSEAGKIIVENYGKTLVLYDDSEIYLAQKPLFQQVEARGLDYSKIGIPFFYFRDETQQTEDGKTILGSYSPLYDYIYIYKDNTDVRTIYHEIGHIIYKVYFFDNSNNKKIWADMYKVLKENKALSTEYAYTDEIEGFAEEYSVYETGIKEQPDAVKDLFRQIDGFLR